MSIKMKAALKEADGTFKIEQVDRVKIPADDWVLARIKVSGICGTDLRHWKKHEPDLECKIMGHEMSAVVVETGPAVRNVKAGDRVVVETLLGDGTCDWCRVQQYNLCPNLYKVRMDTISRSFAEYVVGPSTKFHILPDNVSDEEAALLDTFSVSLHAQKLSGLTINNKVAIIGAGPIGLAQLQLAKLSGAEVIVFDIVQSSLTLAKSLGADRVVNLETEDPQVCMKLFNDGRGADLTFECAGGESMTTTLPLAVSITRIGGKVIIVGGFENGNTAMELNWQDLQKSEISLIPSASYGFWDIYPEMSICVELLAKGKINAKKMITHTYPLDRINEAFETAQNKKETGAVFVALKIS